MTVKASIHKWLHGNTFACYLVRQLGLRGALAYLISGYCESAGCWPSLYRLYSRNSLFPLWCRKGTTDRAAFSQVFIEDQYGCVDPRQQPRSVVDCGANAGYASAYFLSRFPGSRLVAVEPDESNYALLEKNLRPYADCVTLLRAAVWSRPANLMMFGENGAWLRRARECVQGETPDVAGVEMESLVSKSGSEGVDVLKIDVEGAETDIFRADCGGWLPEVSMIAIELHDEESKEVFERTVVPFGFSISWGGETTIAVRDDRR
ncbi:MAG: FkbM family methyltransferase [Kiritimatiellia bacterium]|nr:FkbM family methyltransferase [Kiritimatiellia bacterium]